MHSEWRSAAEIAAAIRRGEISALAVTQAALQRIDRLNPRLGAFTQVTHTRALETAQTVDRKLAAGIDPGVLVGVPFAVKNLFDIAGLPTLAGSRINATYPAAQTDLAKAKIKRIIRAESRLLHKTSALADRRI